MSCLDPPLPECVVFGEALTDFLRTGKNTWVSAAGGGPWNVARVLGTLGVATAWGGAISDDDFGREILEKSASAHLDRRFIQKLARPPLIAIVHRTDPPDYSFLGNGSADLGFDDSCLPRGWQAACRHAHFGGISLVREPLAGRLEDIAADLKRRGATISYDPNCRKVMGDDFVDRFLRMARLADVIKISDEDLAYIYPGCTAEKALAGIRRVAPDASILFTQGAKGMVLDTPNGALTQQAFVVDGTADTVGAGDACIGGFIGSMLHDPSRDYRDHLRFSAATAAATCMHIGPYAPTCDEIAAILSAGGGT